MGLQHRLRFGVRNELLVLLIPAIKKEISLFGHLISIVGANRQGYDSCHFEDGADHDHCDTNSVYFVEGRAGHSKETFDYEEHKHAGYYIEDFLLLSIVMNRSVHDDPHQIEG
jgi:hypothetical protein